MTADHLLLTFVSDRSNQATFHQLGYSKALIVKWPPNPSTNNVPGVARIETKSIPLNSKT